MLTFCGTGRFITPFLRRHLYKVSAEQLFDFIALNYYSRVLIKMQWSIKEPFVSTCYGDEIMTDMPYALYPEGLYYAIETISKFKVPIYITENGIADAHDKAREIFLHRYLYALGKAIKDGYDVRGYYYWTLMDNFEWDQGYKMKFGLYKVDFNTQIRTLRPSYIYYSYIIKKSKAN